MTMGLIKLLVLAIVVFAGLTLWRRLQARKAGRGSRRPGINTPEPMVRCKECRVHIPANKALRSKDDWYCCVEHRDTHSHE